MNLLLILLSALQEDTVSFELKQNIVFVDVTVNGEGPFTFIFDTGASVTVLKPATARKLKLKTKAVGGEGVLGGLLKMAGLSAEVTTVDSIAMGKAEVKDFEAVVMNVPQADIPLSMAGISYDGLIGFHFISRFVTTIDYKAKTIRLVPNDFDPGPTFPSAPAPKRDGTPHLGFSYRQVGDDEANEVGVEGGIVVGTVADGSPAKAAGLQKGDIILKFNGKVVRTSAQFREAVAATKPGDRVEAVVLRDKKETTVTIRVGSR